MAAALQPRLSWIGVQDARDTNPPIGAGALLGGVFLGGWLVVCDVWLKLVTRAGGCEPAHQPLQTWFPKLWSVPERCDGIPLPGGLRLVPGARSNALLGLVDVPAESAALLGLGMLAFATVVSILVLRWSWRIPADALALGTLWAGLGILAAPRVMGLGVSFTEVVLGGVAFGLADFAVVWAMLWLGWRAVAEARA